MTDHAEEAVIASATVSNSEEPGSHHKAFTTVHADLVKGKSVRGGMIVVVAQGLKFALTTGSSMILARLLTPQDFGLQGMVVAVTGFLSLFADIGLGMATIQRDVVTHEQSSTLFWINVALGAALGLLTAALAPALVVFFHEPRLLWITFALATTFLIGSLGAQHGALLMRSMRFVTRAKVEVLSLAVGVCVGVGMAALGCGYWALVYMSISASITSIVGLWLSVRWLPGMPRRNCGLRSMVHFGGAVTIGRACSLVNLPTTQLHTSLLTIAFPALSRLQSDPQRMREAFLRGYSILLSFTIPVTIASLLFADEIIPVLLGSKWLATIPIFKLLVPTVLVFGLINPFGWFLAASGRVLLSLKLALVFAPAIIMGVAIGLRHGPKGVALAYSVVMVLIAVPVIACVLRGTGISFGNLWRKTKCPILSGLIAAVAGLAFKSAFHTLPPTLLMILGIGITLGVFAGTLLIIMRQRQIYADLLRQIFRRVRSPEDQTTPV